MFFKYPWFLQGCSLFIPSSLPLDLHVVDGVVVFSAHDGELGRELWVSDGTEKGTQRVFDIAAGTLSSSPTGFLSQPGMLLFSANDAQHGFEIWGLERPVRAHLRVFSDGFESGGTTAWTSSSSVEKIAPARVSLRER